MTLWMWNCLNLRDREIQSVKRNTLVAIWAPSFHSLAPWANKSKRTLRVLMQERCQIKVSTLETLTLTTTRIDSKLLNGDKWCSSWRLKERWFLYNSHWALIFKDSQEVPSQTSVQLLQLPCSTLSKEVLFSNNNYHSNKLETTTNISLVYFNCS